MGSRGHKCGWEDLEEFLKDKKINIIPGNNNNNNKMNSSQEASGKIPFLRAWATPGKCHSVIRVSLFIRLSLKVVETYKL